MADLELFQFARSHFNEKVRWALDYKGLPHVRRNLLPGPHKLEARRLSGQEQLPVLRHGAEVLSGSAVIIDHLERLQPEPRLYPRDAGELRRALEIQSRFDAEVGPAVRLGVFFELLPEKRYFALSFSDHRGPAMRALYRLALYPISALMKREMGITAEAADRAGELTLAALDRVAAEAGPEGYLVGGAFSVADLTAASLLMPAVEPPEGPGFPRPAPRALHDWLDRWAAHPGADWVRAIYARHRGASAEVAA